MRALAPLLLVALLVGCRLDSQAPDAAAPVPARPAAPAAAADAVHDAADDPVQRDTIEVEGQPTPVLALRVHEPDFALPFDTRVPEGMGVETVTMGERDVARFTLGEPPARSTLIVTALASRRKTVADARGVAREFAEAMGTVTEADAAPAWALVGFQAEGVGGRTGTVWLGRHGRRFFTVATDLAPGAADGMAPRVDFILDRWRWLDDRTGLTTTPAR